MNAPSRTMAAVMKSVLGNLRTSMNSRACSGRYGQGGESSQRMTSPSWRTIRAGARRMVVEHGDGLTDRRANGLVGVALARGARAEPVADLRHRAFAHVDPAAANQRPIRERDQIGRAFERCARRRDPAFRVRDSV